MQDHQPMSVMTELLQVRLQYKQWSADLAEAAVGDARDVADLSWPAVFNSVADDDCKCVDTAAEAAVSDFSLVDSCLMYITQLFTTILH